MVVFVLSLYFAISYCIKCLVCVCMFISGCIRAK